MSDLATPVGLPLPPSVDGLPDRPGVAAWVAEHLGDLVSGDSAASRGDAARHSAASAPPPRGGQQAADAALAGFDPSGYAARRNEVWPADRRGASGLSPWVRHGLLTLRQLWNHVADAAPPDRDRFRDELLWQEYARHLYARLGSSTCESLRFAVAERAVERQLPIPAEDLACQRLVHEELEDTGWLPNQARMWLASWWVTHAGGGWRDGEDWLFARLLDGSRAANRLGWQWVAGAATGSPWVLDRQHVERRAPGLCDACPRRLDCPLEQLTAPVEPSPPPVTPISDPRLDAHPAGEPGGEVVTGPAVVEAVADDAPTTVWLTAESLGDDDPALAAHPELPAVFVFDAPLLARLGLSAERLVFLAETLTDLATRREVRLWRGDPVAVLADQSVAVTFAPVPGFATRARAIAPSVLHPWPWLVRPRGAPLRSYSAWRRALDR